MKKIALWGTALFVFGLAPQPRAQQQVAVRTPDAPGTASSPSLMPTNHPRVPRDIDQLWFVPRRAAGGSTATSSGLAEAIALIERGSYEKSLSALSTRTADQGPLELREQEIAKTLLKRVRA